MQKKPLWDTGNGDALAATTPCQVARPLRIRLLPHRKQKSCNCVGIFTNHSTVKMGNSHAEPSLKDKCSMFTGLVEHLGTINSIAQEPPGVRLAIAAGPLAQGVQIGDSICTNGCCLSVIKNAGGTLEFQLGPETLQRTNFGSCKSGDYVNLERSLTLQSRLDGHLVTGHIDGLGILEERIQEKDWVTCRFTCPKNLLNQLVAKGSIAVDGVSLTVVSVNETSFSVALIPHTLENTTLGALAVGDTVNLETDLLSKYVCRWLESRS